MKPGRRSPGNTPPPALVGVGLQLPTKPGPRSPETSRAGPPRLGGAAIFQRSPGREPRDTTYDGRPNRRSRWPSNEARAAKPGKLLYATPTSQLRSGHELPTKPGRRSPGNLRGSRACCSRDDRLPTKPGRRSPGNRLRARSRSRVVQSSNEARAAKPGKRPNTLRSLRGNTPSNEARAAKPGKQPMLNVLTTHRR